MLAKALESALSVVPDEELLSAPLFSFALSLASKFPGTQQRLCEVEPAAWSPQTINTVITKRPLVDMIVWKTVHCSSTEPFPATEASSGMVFPEQSMQHFCNTTPYIGQTGSMSCGCIPICPVAVPCPARMPKIPSGVSFPAKQP